MGATSAVTQSIESGNPTAARCAARLSRRRALGDKGTAVIEFALVLPFLAVLVFGTVDLGRAFQLKNRLTNAAREGAWYGQFHPCDSAGITSAATDEDSGISSLPGYTVSTSVAGCPSAPTGNLSVVVSARMTVLTPFVGAITGQVVTVSGRSTVVVQ